MYAALGMPIKKPSGDGDFAGPNWGTHLTLTTCLGGCLGVTRAQLKRLLGAWRFALSFRRECLSILDVSFVGAQSLPSRKLCKPSGALLDELVLVSVLAPPVFGFPALASSQQALRLRRLGLSCGRVSSPVD